MPNIKGQPVNQKLEDIEDGLFKKICFNCRGRNVKLVALIGKLRTHNFTSACTNEKCFRYWDLKQTPSWVQA